jgi:hypothetical protein
MASRRGCARLFSGTPPGSLSSPKTVCFPMAPWLTRKTTPPGFVVMPAAFDAAVEFTNTATYSGVSRASTRWTGTATTTFTVIDEQIVYVLPGTFTALRVQLVIDWEEIGTGFTAHGTQTLVWWMVKDYGMARMNFISAETVTETGQAPESDYVSVNFALESTNLIPVIEIPDPGLEAAIRASLRKFDGDLTLPDMESLALLNTNDRGITDLTGLEMATNLTSLTLSFNEIEDLSPLAGLTQLKTLRVDRNRVRDLSPIAGLTTITFLDIWTNHVTDVTPIAGLVDLYRLDLRNNSIADITPLATLESLTHVQVQANFLDLGEGSPNAAIIAGWEKPGTEVFVTNQYTPAPAEANFRLEIVAGEPRFTYEPEPGGLYRIALSPDMTDWVGPYEFISGIFGTPRLDFPLLEESEADEMYYRLMVSFLD